MAMTEKEILDLIKEKPELKQYIEYQAQKVNGTHVKKEIADEETKKKYGFFFKTDWGGYYRLTDSDKIGIIIRRRIDPYGLTAGRAKMFTDWRDDHLEKIDNSSKVISMNDMSYAQYEIFKKAYLEIAELLSKIGDGYYDYYDKDGCKHTLNQNEVGS